MLGSLQRQASWLLAIVLIFAAPVPAAASDGHGVPLPRGARALDDGVFSSPKSFRDTVKFYRRFLRKRGNRHREVPVYRYRGVTVARFLNELTGSGWSAIHVFIIDGRTQIFVVPDAAAGGKPVLDDGGKPG